MTSVKKERKIQIKDLKKVRKIITSIIGHLNKEVINAIILKKSLHESEELKEQLSLLIGSKGDVTSAISKLTNLLIKIIPLEQQTCEGLDGEEIKAEDTKILGEDSGIIERLLGRSIKVCQKNL